MMGPGTFPTVPFLQPSILLGAVGGLSTEVDSRVSLLNGLDHRVAVLLHFMLSGTVI